MRRIALAAIAVILVFSLANFSFAANDFQIKGTVTKINGKQITIKDYQGKDINVESNVSGIKVNDAVLLKGTLFSLRTKLEPQEIDFLVNQCSVDRNDVNVIEKLEEQTRINLMSFIDKKDCRLFNEFKASRAYFRQLKPKTKLPLPPAGWSTYFLTDEEFEQYSNIIANAPW
jgi:hypothetical protein